MATRRKAGVIIIAPRTLFILVAISFGALFVNAIAEEISSSRHPAVREAGLVLMLIGLVSLAGVIAYLRTRRRRTRQRELMELLALTPTQFEQAVAHLLHDLGYRNVQHVGRSNDLGADLRATSADGQEIVVQCKRLAPGSKVSSPDIQTFIGMATVHHRAHRGIFVTTAEFTKPAIELAEQHRILLWDGKFLSATLEVLHRKQALTAA